MAKDILNDPFHAGEMLTAQNINDIVAEIKKIQTSLTQEPELSYLPVMSEGSIQYRGLTENIVLKFYFTSYAAGAVQVNVTMPDSTVKTYWKGKGEIEVDLGPAQAEGTYIYKVQVRDGANNVSPNTLEFKFSIGGVTLTSTFNDVIKLNPIVAGKGNYSIGYSYSSPAGEGTREVKYQLYQADNTLVEKNTYKIELSSATGSLVFKIPEKAGDYYLLVQGSMYSADGSREDHANIRIDFNVVAENTAKAIVTTDFNTFESYQLNKIKFRANGAFDIGTKLTAVCYLEKPNGDIEPLTCPECYQGYEYSFDYYMEDSGSYNGYIIVYKSSSSSEPTDVNYPRSLFSFDLKEKTLEGSEYVRNGLIASFQASQHTQQENTWRSSEYDTILNEGSGGTAYKFILENINHVTNGWKQQKDEDGIDFPVLSLNGIAYGRLTDQDGNNYNPFSVLSGEANLGCTFEILCRAEDTANSLSCICSTQQVSNEDDQTLGINCKFNQASIKDSTNKISTPLIENQFNHIVFVIDKEDRPFNKVESAQNYNPPFATMKIYINGVLMTAKHYEQPNNASYSNYPLLLNAAPSSSTEIDNNTFGSTQISHIRIYNRPLLSAEVYSNYVQTQMLNQSKVKKIRNRNATPSKQLPSVYFVNTVGNDIGNKVTFKTMQSYTTTDKDGKVKDTYAECIMFYGYYPEGSEQMAWSDPRLVNVYLQGTSTLAYPVKNYKIKTGEAFIPDSLSETEKNKWIADKKYTLKCDYMEQSHRNNTPTARFYDTVIDKLTGGDKNLQSPAKQNGYRDSIDGFPCIVYYTDNTEHRFTYDASTHIMQFDKETLTNNACPFETSEMTCVGSYMFNVDKSGKALGFDFEAKDGTAYQCISYEGGANADYSAATFHDLSFAQTVAIANNKTPPSDDKIKYYMATLEPRYSYYEESGTDPTGEQTFVPLEEAIEWLKQFAPLSDDPKYYDINDYKKNVSVIEGEETIIRKETDEELKERLIQEFRKDFKVYFNFEYSLAYFLQAMMFTQADNIGKNAMFDCWRTQSTDREVINDAEEIRIRKDGWGPLYPRPYDMDTQMGLSNVGKNNVYPSSEFIKELSPYSEITETDLTKFLSHGRYGAEEGSRSYSVRVSRLWSCFGQAYKPEIAQAYSNLRDGTYSMDISSIVDNDTCNLIGECYYNHDASIKYLSQYSNNALTELSSDCLQGNRQPRYYNYLRKRLQFLDSYFNYNSNDQIRIISQANNHGVGEPNITIETYDPCYMSLKATNGPTQTVFIDDIPDENQNQFTMKTSINGSNTNAYLWPASPIKTLNGLKNFYPSELDCSKATKLSGLDLSNCSDLKEIVLSSNTYLKTLNLSGCNNLTTITWPTSYVFLEKLDLSGCSSYTGNIQFQGANLKELILNDSKISSLILSQNMILQKLSFDRCPNLKILNLEDCNNLTDFTTETLISNNLSEIKINKCKKLKTITIKKTNQMNLTKLDLNNNDNLEEIIIDKVVGSGIKELDLSKCFKLKTLKITNSSSSAPDGSITIILPDLESEWTKLSTLDLENSKVKVIRYGDLDQNSDTCNLEGLITNQRTNFVIKNNSAVNKITSLDYTGPLHNLFENCSALETIQANLQSTDASMDKIFYCCYSLKNIEELNITNEGTNETETARSACECLPTQTGSLDATSHIENIIKLPTLKDFTNCFAYNLCNGIAFKQSYNQTEIAQIAKPNPLNDFFATSDGTYRNNFKAEGIFNGSTLIKYIPNNFLNSINKGNTVAINLDGASGITSIDTTWLAGVSIKSLINFYRQVPVGINTLLTSLTKITNSADIQDLTSTFEQAGNANETNLNNSNALILFFEAYSGVKYLTYTFRKCAGIREIPQGLFYNNTNLINCNSTFAGMYSVNKEAPTDIKGSIFTNDTGYSDLTSMTSMFEGSGIKSIPKDFFKNTQDIENLYNFCVSVGTNCLKSIPADLFHPLTKLKNVAHAFHNNSALQFEYYDATSGKTTTNSFIPWDFLEENILLTDCSYLFTINNKDITFDLTKPDPKNQNEIIKMTDDEIIAKAAAFLPPSVIHADQMFALLSGITGPIHLGLFKNTINLKTISSIFRNTSITGPITADIFKNCPALTDVSEVFRDCTQIGYKKQDISDPYYFPNDLFANNKKITTVRNMFRNCFNLNAILKEDTSNSLFGNCLQLTTTRGFFQNCHSLKGNIPSNMFKGSQDLTQLTSIAYMFSMCSSLARAFTELPSITSHGLYNDSDEKYYLIPPGLLDKCPSIQYAQYAFNSMRLYPYIPNNTTVKELKNLNTNLAATNEYVYVDDSDNLTLDAEPTYDIIIPNDLFKNQTKLRTLQYAFNAIPSATIELNTNFVNNQSWSFLENIERICFNTSISKISGFLSGTTPLTPNLKNARYAFGRHSEHTSSNKAFNGLCAKEMIGDSADSLPTPVDGWLKQADTEGLFADQNNTDFKAALANKVLQNDQKTPVYVIPDTTDPENTTYSYDLNYGNTLDIKQVPYLSGAVYPNTNWETENDKFKKEPTIYEKS